MEAQMPTPSNKSNNGLTQRIVYPAFNGGLNLSVPPESIELNELREAINVEYSPKTGSMRVRGGIKMSFPFNEYSPDLLAQISPYHFLIAQKKILYGVYRFYLFSIHPYPATNGYFDIIDLGDISLREFSEIDDMYGLMVDTDDILISLGKHLWRYGLAKHYNQDRDQYFWGDSPELYEVHEK